MEPGATAELRGKLPPLYTPGGTLAFGQWRELVTQYIHSLIVANPKGFTCVQSVAAVCAAITPNTHMCTRALHLAKLDTPDVWLACKQEAEQKSEFFSSRQHAQWCFYPCQGRRACPVCLLGGRD